MIYKRYFFLYFIFFQLFFVGYFFQLFGILSISIFNAAVAIQLTTYCLFHIRLYKHTQLSQALLIFLFLYIIFVYITHNNATPRELLAYELMVFYPLISLIFINSYTGRFLLNPEELHRLLLIILVIQVPFMITQTIFTDVISSISRVPLDPIDMVSGTFFLKNDASLVLFSQLFLSYTLFGRNSDKYNNIVPFLSFFVVILAHSKIGLVNFLFIMIIFFIYRIRRNPYNVTTIFIILMIPTLAFLSYEKVLFIINNNIQDIIDPKFSYSDGEAVSRIGLIGWVFTNNIVITGNGIFDYYNYITKEWKFYGGHSLLFSFYNDIGVIGIISLTSFYFFIIYKSIRWKLLGFVYFVLLMSFSAFNVLLYDIGSLLIIFIFVRALPIIDNVKKSHIPQKQQRLYIRKTKRLYYSHEP